MKWPKFDLKFFALPKHRYLTKRQTDPKAVKKYLKMPRWQQEFVSNVRLKVELMLKWRW